MSREEYELIKGLKYEFVTVAGSISGTFREDQGNAILITKEAVGDTVINKQYIVAYSHIPVLE